MSNREKYLKYKTKYLNLINNNKYIQQTGGNNNCIIFDGISSSGKSSLCSIFNQKGYECIKTDIIYENAIKIYNETVKNKYITKKQMKIKINNIFVTMLFELGNGKPKIVYDFAPQQDMIKLFKNNNICPFILFIYADFLQLAKNINSRKTTEKRGVSVFEQFATKYIITDDIDSAGFDTINKITFKQILKDNLKYLFESEEILNNFANKIFTDIGINDDHNHKIKIKNELHCDYLINVSGKNFDQIINELVRNNIVK